MPANAGSWLVFRSKNPNSQFLLRLFFDVILSLITPPSTCGKVLPYKQSKKVGTSCRKNRYLRDWLLAAWIYEELFDDDPDSTSHNNTRDYDSSYDYDDYEENF